MTPEEKELILNVLEDEIARATRSAERARDVEEHTEARFWDRHHHEVTIALNVFLAEVGPVADVDPEDPPSNP